MRAIHLRQLLPLIVQKTADVGWESVLFGEGLEYKTIPENRAENTYNG